MTSQLFSPTPFPAQKQIQELCFRITPKDYPTATLQWLSIVNQQL